MQTSLPENLTRENNGVVPVLLCLELVIDNATCFKQPTQGSETPI
jgi:hypothetical protein